MNQARSMGMMMPACRPLRLALGMLIALLISGCASYASTNTVWQAATAQPAKVSFTITPRPGKQQEKVLVLLALSGGGSRAAYFSARTMLALSELTGPQGQTVDVLGEVDLISAVSGGSLTAAFYASTYDDDGDAVSSVPAGARQWDQASIDHELRKNFTMRWIGNWFWPTNLLKFWLTAFDRTDIMAQTFADNLFDTVPLGNDLLMRDLNPARPNLIINATLGSTSPCTTRVNGTKTFGSVFTFTEEDFKDKLNADIAGYELARAVMASSTFPAVFNFMTLTDFSDRSEDCIQSNTPGSRYVHTFDGGNSDNLGLRSITRSLLTNRAAAIKHYSRIVVILVDAYRPSIGANPIRPDPRNAISYVVDTNFMESSDSLLEANRHGLLMSYFGRSLANQQSPDACLRESLPDHACVASPHDDWHTPAGFDVQRALRDKLFFFHIAFDAVDDPGLKEALQAIPTTFNLSTVYRQVGDETLRIDEARIIRDGVDNIFAGANDQVRDCVSTLAAIIVDPETAPIPGRQNSWCGSAQAAGNRLGPVPGKQDP